MKIVFDYPPNYIEICREFPQVPRQISIVFTYGDTLYIPSQESPSHNLLAHEEVHVRQQAIAGGPEAWWERYLTDPIWRFGQELQAYQEQYKYIKQNMPRPQARQMLQTIAKDLASPIYGSLTDKHSAKAMILQ